LQVKRSEEGDAVKKEYVEMLEALKEIRFMFFRDIGIPVKFPTMVRNDNIGAMFMA
jgi:hypothetical protein